MSHHVLFIGGSWDGKRYEVEELRPYFKVDVWNRSAPLRLDRYHNPHATAATIEEYRLEKFASHTTVAYLYVLNSLTPGEALMMLVSKYPKGSP